MICIVSLTVSISRSGNNRGAANDIERATDLARKMVMQYGMSDRFGLMALSNASSQYLDGSAMVNCADSTAAAADEEVQKLLSTCYADAIRILQDNRTLLDDIALYLLQKETITADSHWTRRTVKFQPVKTPFLSKPPPLQSSRDGGLLFHQGAFASAAVTISIQDPNGASLTAGEDYTIYYWQSGGPEQTTTPIVKDVTEQTWNYRIDLFDYPRSMTMRSISTRR